MMKKPETYRDIWKVHSIHPCWVSFFHILYLIDCKPVSYDPYLCSGHCGVQSINSSEEECRGRTLSSRHYFLLRLLLYGGDNGAAQALLLSRTCGWTLSDWGLAGPWLVVIVAARLRYNEASYV